LKLVQLKIFWRWGAPPAAKRSGPVTSATMSRKGLTVVRWVSHFRGQCYDSRNLFGEKIGNLDI
jgi:hypothetical protein